MARIIILGATILSLSICACNKSYHCQCLDSNKNSLEHFDIKATKTSDAESKCAEHNDPGGAGLVNCQLK